MTAQELAYLRNMIPHGRQRATSIGALAIATGLDQRTIRDGIERLVNEWHEPIVTLPIRSGVFVATTPEDLDLADAHLRAKAMALLRRRRSLRLCRERLMHCETLF